MTPFFGSSVSSARALRLDSRGGAGMNGRIGPAPSGKASPLRYAQHIAKKHPLKEKAAAQQAAWCRLPFPLALVHLEKQIPFILKPCRCICKTVNPGSAAIPPRIRHCTLFQFILYHKSRPVSIFLHFFPFCPQAGVQPPKKPMRPESLAWLQFFVNRFFGSTVR